MFSENAINKKDYCDKMRKFAISIKEEQLKPGESALEQLLVVRNTCELSNLQQLCNFEKKSCLQVDFIKKHKLALNPYYREMFEKYQGAGSFILRE